MFSTTQSWTAVIKLLFKIMKNLLFGIIATILFAFNGNAQKLSQEDVRLILAKGMAEFTVNLKPAYDKTENVEDFKKTITGCWYSTMPVEGNDLLDAAYRILEKKLSEDEVLKEYNGKELATAVLYLDSLSKKGVRTDGSELFGGTTGDFNPYATLSSAKCRWYQLGCWLNEIFGESVGEAIVTVIGETIVNALGNIKF